VSGPLPKVLFIGYGNPGRLDDGLGPALAARIEALSLKGMTVEADYQLSVENAFDVSQHDVVIFADAAVRGKAPFFFKEIHPQSPLSLGTHSVSPEVVLFFAEKLFHSRARAYVLGIRGYEFNGYDERLSERAKKNLEEAFQFVARLVQSGNLDPSAEAAALSRTTETLEETTL
jgi:hydrogenase maturation protease